jgi:Tfp pilus assembly protein PilO
VRLRRRELALAWATGAIALLALTYALGTRRVREWRELRDARQRLADRGRVARQYLDRRDGWRRELDAFRARLPRHPADRDVTAELLKTLERLSQEQGLALTRREPEPERAVEDLFEVAINCTWEGSLESLVRFLYAVQSQGAMLDLAQLTVQPARSTPDRLKGSFTLNCAYTRERAAAAAGGGGRAP